MRSSRIDFQRADEQLSNLFFAINHYITTGDYLGTGIDIPNGTDHRLCIAYDPSNAVDAGDLDKFKHRLEECATPHEFAPSEFVSSPDFQNTDTFREFRRQHAVAIPEAPQPVHTRRRFRFYELLIEDRYVGDLTVELLSAPGTKGWGSPYSTIHHFFADRREKILKASRSSASAPKRISPAAFGSISKEMTKDPAYILQQQFPDCSLPSKEEYSSALRATWEYRVATTANQLARLPDTDAAESFHLNACNACEDAKAGLIPMPRTKEEMLKAMVYDYQCNVQGMLHGPAAAGKPFQTGPVFSAARRLLRTLGIR